MKNFRPSIAFLRKVAAGEVMWASSRTTEPRLIGGLKTAEAHYDAGLTTTPHSTGAVRLTKEGRAALEKATGT